MGIGKHERRKSSRRERIYNSLPVMILRWAGYDVRADLQDKSLANHIVLMVISFGLCILSLLTLEKIGFFVSLYQIISLAYKCLISFFYSWNHYKIKEKKKTSEERLSNLSSPYSFEFFIYALFVIVLVVTVLFALNAQQSITDDAVRTIIVDFCIFFNCVFDLYDGIKGLYLAEVLV